MRAEYEVRVLKVAHDADIKHVKQRVEPVEKLVTPKM